MTLTDQIAAVDRQIASAQRAATALADERKTEHARLTAALANGIDTEAHEAQRRARQLDDGVAFEEARIKALAAKRIDLVEAEKAADAEKQWTTVEAIARKRQVAAKIAGDAIASLGKALTELNTLTVDLAAAIPNRRVRAIADHEVRDGVSYALIAAGIRWPFADAASARVEGNGIVERVARSNAAALAARNAPIGKAA